MANFDNIFVGGRGHVYALDKETGTLLWDITLKEGFFKTGNELVSLLETAERLYAFSYGTLYRIEKKSGRIEWQTHIPHLKHHAGLMAVEGYVNSIEVGVSCDGDSGGDGGDGGDGGGD